MNEGSFLLLYRAASIGVSVYWLIALALTRGEPPEWRVPWLVRYQARVSFIPGYADLIAWATTRDHYRVICRLGITAGLAVTLISLLLGPA
jgi:hypothetical protein